MEPKTRRTRWLALGGLTLLVLLPGLGLTLRYVAFQRGVAESDARWAAERPLRMVELGETTSLTILPLLDFHASRPELATEVGVSYLITTDHSTILFDLGNNGEDAEPSPLERNLTALGVSLATVDTVVISHAHFDHVGGRRWTDGGLSGTTFGIGREQPSLAGKRVLTPIPMTYPGITPQLAVDPVRIAPGVATTGSLERRLFPELVHEQSLAIRVQGKGIVLVVGCGHPTMTRLLARAHALFAEPIVGVVGGLHYPVPNGRIPLGGLDPQRRLGSGDGPFAPMNEADVEAELTLLRAEPLQLLAVGGHDSSDAVIARVQAEFGAVARALRVGEAMVFGVE